jgi:magnesium chelatase family protein
LRQPLEDGKVTISRASGSMTFPSRCMLVGAMNPCACGYYGDPKRECRCGTAQVVRYRQRISGPLLDRIDIHVEVPLVEYRELAKSESGESSEVIRSRVEAARTIQRTRLQGSKATSNATMSPKQMKEHCRIDEESSMLLENTMSHMNFSARAHDRILRVARTIADLAGCADISADHLLEAIGYRTLDRNLLS